MSVLLVAVISAPAAAELLDLNQAPRSEIVGNVLLDAARPAYRLVEGISDSVYNFMRSHLIGNILPTGLSRQMAQSPKNDSYAAFEYRFREKEKRYLERLSQAYPAQNQFARKDEGKIEAWRSWAAAEQASVAIDSLKDTLLDRYQLEPFGLCSGRYAKDRRNWDFGFLTMAGIIGSTFLYLNGLHADGAIGPWKMGVDLRSGLAVRQAVKNGKELSRVASFELGYKDHPLAAAAQWGLAQGHFRSESVGLKYRLRY
ncbi:MAG: hypothetical protein A3J74_03260 [Elusimicrobia bacterium RIFCSPHIGHO2_02_FULL_57_9]|nr:MAG: hypothetical protein A3J74_03260 [Elusimicrobia bacterium RIFCSPHIGHO2_02_FULL_57_9]